MVTYFPCAVRRQNALAVLNTFDLVMTLEEMSVQSPILIRRAFGWQKNRILSLNNRRDQQKPLPLTDDDLQLLRDHNVLDAKLYRRAQVSYRDPCL